MKKIIWNGDQNQAVCHIKYLMICWQFLKTKLH